MTLRNCFLKRRSTSIETGDRMLIGEQLEMLVGGVSTTISPMWRDDGNVVYLGSREGESLFFQMDLEGGSVEEVTTGIDPMSMGKVGEAHISPDGRWLSYVSSAMDKTGENLELEIWLYPLEDADEPRRLTYLGARVSSFSWSSDAKWLTLSCNRYGSYDVYLVSVPDGRTRRLTSSEHHEVYPRFSADNKRVLYVRLNHAWTDHSIISVDLEGLDERLIVADRDFFDYHCGRSFGYPLVDPKDQCVVFPSYRSGWINYWKVCVAEGSLEPLATADAEQSEGAWSPDGRFFSYIENHRGNLQLRVLDVPTDTVSVLDGDGCGSCSTPTWSPDSSKIAYIYQGLAQPAQLRVVEVSRPVANKPCVRMIAGPAEPDRVQELVTAQRVKYETFDGREIDAFLYSPQDGFSDKAPAIILAHGGPTSQFFETFEHQGTFWSAQYLAQKGYILLLPNVRGSSGYGREFEDLNNCDWGYGDLEDIAYGVDYLKGLEEVDSESIGIYGASYGGSMVMYAVTFKPELFQAAVVLRSGYGDWLNSYEEMEIHHVKMLHYELGPMPNSAHIYRRSSPYYEIERIRTPTMIIHSEKRPPYSPDTREFAEASFADEMKRLMKPIRHRVYQGTSAWSAAGRQDIMQEVGEYFDEYLKGPLTV